MAGGIKGITIKFGADVTQLNSALKKTQGQISKTQAELKQINRALKFNPGNTTLLRQKFELLQRSVTETETKLDQLRKMQARMDASGIDKTTAQYRQLEREIIKAENQLKTAQGNLKRFGSIGKQQAMAVGNAFKMAGSKIKSAGRTITTTMSVYGVAGIYAGSRLIEMANKQAEAEQKLTEIYKSRMGVGKAAVQSTLELASAEQKVGVVGDEVQIAAAQQLATYAKYPNTVNTMLPAINDLLVQQKGLNATQEDASALANLFGKAMMGQTGALKRAGISFTAAQEEVLKYGTEEEKAAMIAEVVKQNVGDMNEAFAKTDAGKIQQAKNALGDMGEQIGAVLLPAVADLVSWFQANLMPKLEQLIGYFQQHPAIAKFALAFASIAAVLGPVIMVVGTLINAIGTIITIAPAVGSAFSVMLGPVGIAIAVIAGLVAAFVILWKKSDKFRNFWINLWNNIKKIISKVLPTIKKVIMTVFNAIKTYFVTLFKIYKTIFVTAWKIIKTVVTTYINAVKKVVMFVFNALKIYFTTLFKIYKTIFTTAWNVIKTVVTTVVNTIKAVVTKVFGAIKSFITTVWTGIKSATTTAWNAIKNAIVNPITTAKNTLSNIIGKIKGFFPLKIKNVWSDIKSKLTQPIKDAKETIDGVVEKIKGMFPFNLGKILKLKLPKISVSKGKAPWGIGGKGKLPSFSVAWNKKAMQNPYMFSNATLFGAGEAGDEILYGRNRLLKDIAQAVGGNAGGITVNVYGSDGMSVTELANAVERKLIQTQQRRTQAWA